MLRPLLIDFDIALQRCRRRPRLFMAASAVMSLGIAWATTVFAIGDALFMRPLAIEQPERVFYVYSQTGASPTPIGAATAAFLRTQGTDLADFTSLSVGAGLIGPVGFAQAVFGETVGSTYFSVLGVPIVLGRQFKPEDVLPGSVDVVILGHELWTRHFKGDPNAIGQRIRIDTGNRSDYIVVGIAPRDFRGLSGPLQPSQFWIPAKVEGPQIVVARLKHGVKPNEFAAMATDSATTATELLKNGTMPGQLATPFTNLPGRVGFAVLAATSVRIPSNPTAQIIPSLALSGMVGVTCVLLLVATFNAAALVLADCFSRHSEVMTLTALGVTKGRLLRQFAAWGCFVAISSWAVGWALAMGFIHWVGAILPPIVGTRFTLNERALLFAAVTSLTIGLIVAVVPVLFLLRHLGENPLGRHGAAPSGRRLKRWVVLPQVATTIFFSVISVSYLRSLVVLPIQGKDGRTLSISLTTRPSEAFGEGAASLEATLRDRLTSTTGITSVATTTSLPILGFESASTQSLAAEGSQAYHPVGRVQVSGDYFRLLHQDLVAGRTFVASDASAATPAVVLTESAAKLMWPGASPIGRRLLGRGRQNVGSAEEVVGIVKDPIHLLGGAIRPTVLSLAPDTVQSGNQGWRTVNLVVSGDRPVAELEQAIRVKLSQIQPALSVVSIKTIAETEQQVLYPRRVAAIVSLGIAIATQLLSFLALYVVFSYLVTAHARDFAIQASLGAGPGRLVGGVLLDAARLVFYASAFSLPVALLASVILSRLVRGVPPVGIVAFLVVPTLTLLASLLATLRPARAAGAANPAKLLHAV